MSTRAASFLRAFAIACLIASIPVGIAATRRAPDLTVHEWGTFTSLAGDDGQAMQWLPLGGPTDLPCFVEYYKNRLYKVTDGAGRESVRLGSELKDGIEVTGPGRWIIAPMG